MPSGAVSIRSLDGLLAEPVSRSQHEQGDGKGGDRISDGIAEIDQRQTYEHNTRTVDVRLEVQRIGFEGRALGLPRNLVELPGPKEVEHH